MERFPKLRDVLGNLARCGLSTNDATNTMNDVNIERKRFKAFTHASMNLSTSLLRFTLLTASRNRAACQQNFIIPPKRTDGRATDCRVLTGGERFRHGIFL